LDRRDLLALANEIEAEADALEQNGCDKHDDH
jgi:hypothetical protein